MPSRRLRLEKGVRAQDPDFARFQRLHYGRRAGRLYRAAVDRDIRPLLENYRGVHFEVSSFWPPEGVRDLARKYGADRILYGSGFPRYNHGNMMAAIRNLELDEADKRLVASGNLERILSEERP